MQDQSKDFAAIPNLGGGGGGGGGVWCSTANAPGELRLLRSTMCLHSLKYLTESQSVAVGPLGMVDWFEASQKKILADCSRLKPMLE